MASKQTTLRPPAKGFFSTSPFWLRLTRWEYWPMYVANLPLAAIWLWFTLRARHPFFFSAVNPSIETGGLLGESKMDILRKIPEKYIPKTRLIEAGTTLEEVEKLLLQEHFHYPLICKPNIGERGFLVTKINHSGDLAAFLRKCPEDFLLQEFIDLPLELSILHHRFPDAHKGSITSICIKRHLTVTGDGHSTVRQLMQAYGRAHLQLARFESEGRDILETVPPAGVALELEPIGNHSRGTMFLDGNHQIQAVTTTLFDQISRGMEGVHYGRFDLKCAGWESLQTGEGIKIVEYNGIGGEPAHIYDPSIPVWKKYRDLYRHWKIIFQLYRAQRRKGVKPMTLRAGWGSWERYKRYMKRFSRPDAEAVEARAKKR